MKTNRNNTSMIHTVTLPGLFLCAFAILAYFLHLFTYELSAAAYCIVLFILVLGFVITKPVTFRLPLYYVLSWIAALSVALMNYLFRFRSVAVRLDVYVLLINFFIILFFSIESATYTAALKAVKITSLFFAVSVLIQVLLPSVYRLIIRLFPGNIRYLLRLSLSMGKNVGFATNPGFVAGYIIVGIFAVYSLAQQGKNAIKRNLFTVLLFIIALMMTTKRGPFLFMFLTIAIVQILPMRGTKRAKRLFTLLVIVLFIIVLFFFFQNLVGHIPLLYRYITTIQDFLSGEDVSNGRTNLAIWALSQFRKNPLFGIGWGRYKTTTIGNATLTKSLDTHNVYLQLLCETGIIGFAVFILLFILFWNSSRKNYCACIRNRDPNLLKWSSALLFSFAFQTYFLLYCLSGNPLYDQFYQIMYALSCSIVVAYEYVSKCDRSQESFRKGLLWNSNPVIIDVLVFHYASNDIDFLQRYALQSFLGKQGYQIRLMDYRYFFQPISYKVSNNHIVYTHGHWQNFHNAGFISQTNLSEKSYIRCLYLNDVFAERNMEKAFDGFDGNIQRFSEQLISSKQLLPGLQQADLYVVVNNRSWNPEILDCEYDFTYNSGNKLSKTVFSQAGLLCEKISVASVGDYNARMFKIIERKAFSLLDPTLLLKPDDYLKVEEKAKKRNRYIFVYGFEDSDAFHNAVHMVQNRRNLQIVNGSPNWIHLEGDVINLSECAPSDLLSLIKNAQFVVTNSFHCTALSVVFKKEFLTLPHSTDEKRMIELLNKLGLLNRFWNYDEFSIDNPIEWSIVDNKLKVLQNESRKILLSVINDNI